MAATANKAPALSNDPIAIVAAVMRARAEELLSLADHIGKLPTSCAKTKQAIALDFAKEVCDPVWAAIGEQFTDCGEDYRSLCADAIDGNLLFDIQRAENDEIERREEELAECSRASRSDYDEHNTLNRAQQGLGGRGW